MQLKSVLIRNFRGLKEIEFDLPTALTVIVGPNAVGKTSVLEAIRIAKSILMESYDGEGMQVLQTLGVLSPNIGRVTLNSFLGDTTKQLLIKLTLGLSANEIAKLRASITQLAIIYLRDRMGIRGDETTVMRLLSSGEGQKQLEGFSGEVLARLDVVEKSGAISISLIADPATNVIRGGDLLEQVLATQLARSVAPSQGIFSYFPADRAMPTGEVAIQLGTPDMQQQMQSHMGMPAMKYARLKNYVVTQFLMGEESRRQLKEDFDVVFSNLLSDKKLQGLSITPNGLVSIVVHEPARNANYDIDSMSSGEKGLVLTFLLLRRACAPEGVILLDEPELHLNPSVTRRVVPFLLKNILDVTPSQAVICTHSHEIIADAYNRDDCTLLHLRNGSVISLVRRQDKAEIHDVLKRLGVDAPDVLSVRGTLFVEGKEDLDLLEIGFPERVGGYRVVPLGGRGEIEKEIRALQAREQQIESPQCFIFDLDNKPSGLTSTGVVRVAQWDRYCFENYLLEEVCIFDALATIPAANKPVSVGQMRPLLKELALSQVPLEVIRHAYESYKFENAGFRRGVAESAANYEEAGEALSKVLEVAKQSLSTVELDGWRREFVAKCQGEDARIRPEWDEKWKGRADGKRLFTDLHRHIQAKISLSEFKKRVMLEVARAKAPSWREVDSLLAEVIPARGS